MSKDRDKKLSGENWEMEQWLKTHDISLEEKYDLENTPRPKKKGKQRRKSTREPEEILDLHGYKVEEALTELRSFLVGCKLKGCFLVKIIHGKGLHSQGDAKIRTMVRDYLNSEGRNMFTSWQNAPPAKGGDGAVYIYL